MALLTTDDLVTRCAERFDDPSNRIVSNAQWVKYLNEGYQEVNSKFRAWPWNRATNKFTITTAVNTPSYTISAADVYAVESVWNETQSIRMKPVAFGSAGYLDSWDQPAVSNSAVDDAGQPLYYRMVADKIYFYPQADAVYTIYVEATSSPPDLASATPGPIVSPLWPNRFRRALVEYALSRAYQDDGNADWYGSHKAAGDSIVASMAADLIQNPLIEAYPGVVDDWYS